MRSLRPLLIALLVGGCAFDSLESAPCQVDADCFPGTMCLLGTCHAPSQELGLVDVEVEPLSTTGLLTQGFLSFDPRRTSRDPLVMRPTLVTDVRVCTGCAEPEPGIITGELTLTAPTDILGHVRQERTAVDSTGMTRARLLENTPYQTLLFPADERAPLLRGEHVYPVQQLIAGPLQVELPNPDDVNILTGQVVMHDRSSTVVPVSNLRVWAMLGPDRLVRDVLTDENGQFTIRLLKETASGLTVWIAPDSASSPLPQLSLPNVNLDGDRDLGLISLGIQSEPVPVRGRISGPDGRGVPGATVKLEGPAGNGTLKTSTITDANGNYELSVPPGTYARAVVPVALVNAALRQDEAVQVQRPSSGEALVMDVALGSAGQVCGHVRDHERRGVAGATVHALRVANAMDLPGPASDATVDARTRTDGEGSYCVQVGPGRYLVTATPDEESSLPARTDLLDVGTTGVEHDLNLPPPAVLVGTVHGPDGQPLSLARIRAFSPVLSTVRGALELGEAFTDDNGNFRLIVPDLAGVGRDE